MSTDDSHLATVAQQNNAVKARRVGERAKRAQDEWMRDLKRRGIEVNGDQRQRATGYAAREYKSPIRSRPTTLKDAARAFDIAMAAGLVRYLPVEGYDDDICRQNAADRLPASCSGKVRRLSRGGRRYS